MREPSDPVDVVDVGAAHVQQLHPQDVLLTEVHREDILTRPPILKINILRPQTQIHGNVVLAQRRRIHHRVLSVHSLDVDVGAVVAEDFDGPLFVMLNCHKEWRVVPVLDVLVKNAAFFLDEELSQLQIIMDDRLTKRRLPRLRQLINIGAGVYEADGDLVGVFVVRAEDEG